MAWTGRAVALAAALILGACVVPPPAGPSVGALPPKGKDAAQFQQDDLTCRQYAWQMLGGADAAPYSALAQQQQYDQAYTQCMTAHGNIAPVAAAGAPAYAYPYYPYPYYPYAYDYPYAYGYPWYWGAPVGVGASFFFFGNGHGHGRHGHFHSRGSGPRH